MGQQYLDTGWVGEAFTAMLVFFVLFNIWRAERAGKTGKEVYGKVRIDPGVNAFTSSPWAYNGKIFCLSEDGDTFVIQGGPEFKLLGKNSLDEMCMATPAIARGSLIIRTASKLYRITKGGAGKAL